MKRIFSGIMLTLFFVSMLTLAFNIQTVKASGTIYIRADGSIDGPANITTVDKVTYTFNESNYDEIVVERNNILIDGNWYMLQGKGVQYSVGLNLTARSNVTIKNINVKNFDAGIYLYGSSNNIVSGNTITDNNKYGIMAGFSSSNRISENTITDNNWAGIHLYYSSNNRLSGNTATANNDYGINLYGSSNNVVSGNSIANNHDGIFLYHSSNNNSICENNIAKGSDGIDLEDSSYNCISGNNVTATEYYGITFWYSSNNNSIIGNVVTANNGNGIFLSSSSNNNSIIGNVVTANNGNGIFLGSSNNKIIHNNFINNNQQAYSESSANIWDNGCEGNYWSDYDGVDSDGDGIGDTPYVVDEWNEDNFPLMIPYVEGDVNFDGIVNMRDIGLVCGAFNSYPGHPDWNCHYDINGDGVVNMRDIGIACDNFMKTY